MPVSFGAAGARCPPCNRAEGEGAGSDAEGAHLDDPEHAIWRAVWALLVVGGGIVLLGLLSPDPAQAETDLDEPSTAQLLPDYGDRDDYTTETPPAADDSGVTTRVQRTVETSQRDAQDALRASPVGDTAHEPVEEASELLEESLGRVEDATGPVEDISGPDGEGTEPGPIPSDQANAPMRTSPAAEAAAAPTIEVQPAPRARSRDAHWSELPSTAARASTTDKGSALPPLRPTAPVFPMDLAITQAHRGQDESAPDHDATLADTAWRLPQFPRTAIVFESPDTRSRPLQVTARPG